MSSSSSLINAPFDPQARAEVDLDRLLDATSRIAEAKRSNQGDVNDELKKQQMLEAESSRLKSRVLFVTSDAAVLTPGTVAQQALTDLSEVFDEVHIILLTMRGAHKTGSVRLAAKVWVYTVVARFFVQLPFSAKAVAAQELLFTDGFRPDIIIALDPYESAAAAYLIATHFDRPLQIQVRDDSFIDEKKFTAAHKFNSWRLRFMRYVLRRSLSVRASTDSIKNALKDRYKKIDDLVLLPRFFNTKTLLALPAKPDTDFFAQFSFTILFMGDLTADSTLFRALDAARPLLQTPSIGFVIIGDGPQKTHFKERAKILGIDTQVLFLGALPDSLQHLRSADVLLVTDDTSESDDVVIKAAALGVPLIMARTPLRADLFADGVSAFICEPEDTLGFAAKLRTFINTNALRTQFTENGRMVIETRIEEDPHIYRLAYRDTIEQVLYHVEAPAPAPKASATPVTPAPPTTIVDGIEMKLPEEMKK